MFNSSLNNDNAFRPEMNLERLYANWQTDCLANLDESWPVRFFFSDGTAVFYPPLRFKLQRGASCWVVQHLANSVRYQGQYNPSWILSSCFALTSRSKRQKLQLWTELCYLRISMRRYSFFCTAIRTPLFIRKLDSNLRKIQYKLLHWSTASYGAETWTLRKIHQKRLESFEMWSQRSENINCIDRVRNAEVLNRVNGRNILYEIKRAANCNSHILRRNCLLKRVIEWKIKVG
jgi:hypothetical protein